MSNFSDTPPPPHPYISPPFLGGSDGGFWPPFLMENEPSDLTFQFDRPPPLKRFRNSENLPKFSPYPPIHPRTNAPGNRSTGHMFYKTRICAKFMEGTCKNGDRCTFAHGAQDLREPLPNWQELIREKDRRFGTGGSSSGEDQTMSHRTNGCYKYGEDLGYRGTRDFFHERSSPPNFAKLKADDGFKQRESFAITLGSTSDDRGRRSFGPYDQFNCKFKNHVADNSEDCRAKTGFWRTKRSLGGSEETFQFARSQSGAHVEAELFIESNSGSTRPMSPGNLLIDAQVGEDRKSSKWKLGKKINRIYADWLDDQAPTYPEREWPKGSFLRFLKGF